jgi:hypothetical protein
VQTLSEARERRADMLLDELLDRELTYMFAATIAKDPAAEEPAQVLRQVPPPVHQMRT